MDTNEELVDYLVDRGYIKTERVEKAFRNVDRANFMPEGNKDMAYSDTPTSIGKNATISAPHIVAINTELLKVEDQYRVAEIGSGSGYQAAILSELCREVIGIEIIEELVKKSRERLDDRQNVTILRGDGLKAVDETFDRILYSCAIDSFEETESKLKPEGIAVAPVYENGVQVLKRLTEEGVEEHGRVSFVPRTEMEED